MLEVIGGEYNNMFMIYNLKQMRLLHSTPNKGKTPGLIGI